MQQPKIMSTTTVHKLGERIKCFGKRQNLKSVTIIIHGGEPLLAGKQFMKYFVQTLNAALGDEIIVNFFLQTNGLLLDLEWLRIFDELNINLGISLDGDKETNDKYRLDHKGRGSYDRVIKKYRLAHLNSKTKQPPAVLSVIDVNSDPKEQYRHHKEAGVMGFDLLFPHSNWDSKPPVAFALTRFANSQTPYGDWLSEMFDIWFYDNDREKRPKIRKFKQIVRMILGSNVSSDDLGGGVNNILVVETNGAYEAGDALKICGEGFTKAGASVLNDEIEEGLNTELAKYYFNSHLRLSNQCLKCQIRNLCGGGYLPHRYKSDNGFDNPSVYCYDIAKLITHIQNRVISAFPNDLKKELKIEALDFNEVIKTATSKRSINISQV